MKLIPVIQKGIEWVKQHKEGFIALGHGIRDVVIRAYDAMKPALHAAGDLFHTVAGFVSDHRKGLEQLAKVIGTVVVVSFKIIGTYIRVSLEAFRALVSAVDWVAKHFNTFKTTVVDVFQGLRKIVVTGVRFIVDVFLSMAGTIIHAAASAFGWVPGLGGKLKTARDQFDTFKQKVDDTLSAAAGSARSHHINVVADTRTASNALDNFSAWFTGTYIPNLQAAAHVSVTATTNYGGVPIIPGSNQPPHHAAGTNYAPGGWSWVGERGPELVNLPRGSKVLDANRSKQLASSSGDTYHIHEATNAAAVAVEVSRRQYMKSL